MTPYGKIAEFLVNGVTFKTLQKKSTGCFSAISNINCVTDTCLCSANGNAYSLNIKDALPNTILNISCSMKFVLNQTMFASDNIRISVLDISGPYIYPNTSFPIMAGTNVKLICSVESSLKILLQLSCLNISIRETKIPNNTVMQVALQLEAKAHFDKELCTCVVQYKKFKASTSISLNISSPPALEVFVKQFIIAHLSYKNISFEIYGKITQQTVYSTNLSMEEYIPGKYTAMLSNKYGQVRTTFNWKLDKPGQLFFFVLLVLTGMIVFILTAGVIAVIIKIKSTIGKGVKPGKNATIVSRDKNGKPLFWVCVVDDLLQQYGVHLFIKTRRSTSDRTIRTGCLGLLRTLQVQMLRCWREHNARIPLESGCPLGLMTYIDDKQRLYVNEIRGVDTTVTEEGVNVVEFLSEVYILLEHYGNLVL
ncbi:unnamed protein product [Mytilus edulis]|uniref:Uncharacterized protein n=1 Tax=Mytilus edulis TaxID=6550 RepID=A0A8S3RKX3_MYTED|nr:unnamed protein product [Mytilus edulis]